MDYPKFVPFDRLPEVEGWCFALWFDLSEPHQDRSVRAYRLWALGRGGVYA